MERARQSEIGKRKERQTQRFGVLRWCENQGKLKAASAPRLAEYLNANAETAVLGPWTARWIREWRPKLRDEWGKAAQGAGGGGNRRRRKGRGRR